MATTTSTIKEAVKETLIGTNEPVQMSTQHKARFTSHAVKDPETGELFLGPDEFIDAVAPSDEDFVSWRSPSSGVLREVPTAVPFD